MKKKITKQNQVKVIEGYIEAISQQAKGYGVKVNGEWYNSFDEVPEELIEGMPVRLSYVENKKGDRVFKNIKDIQEIEEIEEQEKIKDTRNENIQEMQKRKIENINRIKAIDWTVQLYCAGKINPTEMEEWIRKFNKWLEEK